jgi:excisionase family DNA binding protein
LTARERLHGVLAPELLDVIDEFVAEGLRAALADLTPNGSPWLSLAQAANYLGVSERTVERGLARGRLRSSSIGRRRLLHRDDLDAYVRATGEE